MSTVLAKACLARKIAVNSRYQYMSDRTMYVRNQGHGYHLARWGSGGSGSVGETITRQPATPALSLPKGCQRYEELLLGIFTCIGRLLSTKMFLNSLL